MLAGEEVEHDVVVGEVADLRPVGGRQAADARQQRRGPCAALVRRAAAEPATTGAERVRPAVLGDVARAVRIIQSEFDSASSLVAPHAVMPCPPRITPIASGWAPLDRRDVESELEPGPSPRHPQHAVAEALLGQLLPVGGGRDRDPGVGVEVVDVGGVDEAVHRGVDRRRRAALAVQAVVERGDHLVLALDARGRRRRAQRRRSSRRTARPASVSVPRSPPEPLTHSSSTGRPVTGSIAVPLAEVLPPA